MKKGTQSRRNDVTYPPSEYENNNIWEEIRALKKEVTDLKLWHAAGAGFLAAIQIIMN